MVVDVLQDFGVFFESTREGGVGCNGFREDGEDGEFSEGREEAGFTGAETWGHEEKEVVGADVDGVKVGNVSGDAALGFGEVL